MPSPCCPPLASWVKVVITYLLSDFRGLWQAMQFSTRIGATSRMKLTGFPAAGAIRSTAFFSAVGGSAGFLRRILARLVGTLPLLAGCPSSPAAGSLSSRPGFPSSPHSQTATNHDRNARQQNASRAHMTSPRAL